MTSLPRARAIGLVLGLSLAFAAGLTCRDADANGDRAVTAFTGAHLGIYQGEAPLTAGTVLVATGDNRAAKGGALGDSETLYGLDTTATQGDVAVLGVFGSWTQLEGRKIARVHAVGDGFVLVTDKGGDVRVGDLLTTSTRRGYACRQGPQSLMNFTVAKAMHAVRWDTVAVDPALGFKWKLIPCTFTAG